MLRRQIQNLRPTTDLMDLLIFALISFAGILCLVFLYFEYGSGFDYVATGGIAITVLFYAWYAAWQRRRARKNTSDVQQLRALFYTLGAHSEIVLWDETGETLWSTHPNTYPHKDAFIQRVFSQIAPSATSAELKRLIDSNLAGSIIVETQTKLTHQKPQRLLIRIMPCDAQTFSGMVASITDLTPYLEGYDALKKDHKRLEMFLDQSPVGIIYQDAKGFLLGANQTFCQWIGQDIDHIKGHRISDFFEEGELNEIATLKIADGTLMRVQVSKTSDQRKAQPILLTALSASGAPLNNESAFGASYAHAPIPTIITNIDGKILQWNPAFRGMLGDRLDMDPHRELSQLLHPAVRSEVLTKMRRTGEGSQPVGPFEMRFMEDLLHTTTYVSRLPMKQKESAPQLLLQFIDISEQKRLERQFIQSQKMQAVGQLAGGIAHDFNNLLTAMIGYCDLLLQRYMPNDPSYSDVMQVKQNAARAANLVRQLLAFSRQQTLQPKVVNITDTLTELSVLLRRLIGAGIDLKLKHERDLWPVKVDPSQLEQVIINMAVNARDAMSQGGQLTIATANITLSRTLRTGHDILIKGDYVTIDVTDTGHGIAPEHIEHIFEPFFSTKEVGAGTGLGLSTVFGIVKQTGGVITVESQINTGTTFRVYLPRYTGEEVIEGIEREIQTGDLTGHGTVMLVEDEDAVRMFSARALREKGYIVVEANSGERALELLNQGQKIDLLVTDVVMPKMDGPTLSKNVQNLYPNTKTIFISGYTEDTFRKDIDKHMRIHFLQKPFTLKELASKVKEVLKTEEH